MARISELIIAIKCLPIELLSDPCINSTIFVSLILYILLILSNLNLRVLRGLNSAQLLQLLQLFQTKVFTLARQYRVVMVERFACQVKG